ncbi:MAG: hypothetical protein AAGF23_10990 [Acidobacteriota bacterium]
MKTGGTLKTAVGLLSIKNVEQIALDSITDVEAQKAGYPDLDSLLTELESRRGQTYQIKLAYAGEDPRIALRQDDNLTGRELDAIVARLVKMDSRSRVGKWTADVLSAIEAHPMTAAIESSLGSGATPERLETDDIPR